MQGSFALGAGDLHSDCDFLVATRGATRPAAGGRLRALHDEIPTRDGHWPHDLEGSYAPADELADVAHLGATWLFNNHGHRTLEWDDHCNRAYTRWILRERGITLAGPEPATWMAPVPSAVLRRESATALPTLLADLATWVDLDALAWGQRYAVVTACRMLYTIDTGRGRQQGRGAGVGRVAPRRAVASAARARCATTVRSASSPTSRRVPGRRRPHAPSSSTP